MQTFSEVLKEIYLPLIQADLKRDMERTLFWNPNPPYGPPAPAWLTAGKMFDDAYTWDPPTGYYDEEGCECCG